MTKDFHFNTADALEKAKADRDKPVTPVEYKPVISDVGSDSNMLWPDKPFVPKGTGKLTLHNAAQRQWVSLTADERYDIRASFRGRFLETSEFAEQVQLATEAKLKEKNT